MTHFLFCLCSTRWGEGGAATSAQSLVYRRVRETDCSHTDTPADRLALPISLMFLSLNCDRKQEYMRGVRVRSLQQGLGSIRIYNQDIEQ